MLGPDEQFTLISISGGKPKVPNKIKSICLLLGPDYSTVVFCFLILCKKLIFIFELKGYNYY
jgi:hypothetical protein